MPNVTQVSAVLLNWRRRQHIEPIISHLRTFPQIKDIIVWLNEAGTPIDTHRMDDVHTFYRQNNECTLGRFVAAEHARCDAVFVQDDDLAVNNIPALLAAYDGTKIVANLADDGFSHHWQFWQRFPKPYVEIGFGAVFPKRFATEYLTIPWTDDEELRKRKSDKAFTTLFPWQAIRAGPDDLMRLFTDGKESGRDDHALSRREDHHFLTRSAVDAALAWKADNQTSCR